MESESLGRYRPGGYHPVNIGDSFSSGRYRVVHKLGWGGYSTVWLAYDSSLSRLVALKIVVSELREVSNEIRILRHISSISTAHEGYRHLRKIVDHFLHDGPNGRHQCLVFNVDGISAPALLGHYGGGERLPGSVAWDISRQLLLAVDCLHSNGIGHADLYPGNVLVSSSECQFSDPASLVDLDNLVQVDVGGLSGSFHSRKSLPRFIVEPVSFHTTPLSGRIHATLIDFEQAFLRTDPSLATVRTPLIFRAPETLLSSKWDLRIDIWSLACTIFERVTGQPPFDNLMPAKAPLVLEWIAMFGDVPEEWGQQAQLVVGDRKDEIPAASLSDWLLETYFDSMRKVEFERKDIQRLGNLLTQMMRYRPQDRLAFQDVLKHEWFAENPLANAQKRSKGDV